MNLDSVLRAAALDVTDPVQPPPVDIDGLIHRGRRARQRRAAGAVAALGGLVVAGAFAVTGLSGVSEDAEPAPVDEPPPSGPWLDSALWFDDRSAHLGGEAVPRVEGELRGMVPVGDGVAYGLADGRVVHQDPGGTASEIGRHDGLGPTADVDGTTVAWFDGRDLVAHDVATSEEVGRVDVGELVAAGESRGFRRDHLILDVSADVIRFVGADAVWDWRFADRGARLERAAADGGEQIVDSAGSLDALVGPQLPGDASDTAGLHELSVRSEGSELWRRGGSPAEATFSADGRYLATRSGVRDGVRLIVLDVDSGEAVDLEAPVTLTITRSHGWGWADADTLMAVVTAGITPSGVAEKVLACVISERRCHVVADGPASIPRS